jgi:mono/diheme cytochrome c family protein
MEEIMATRIVIIIAAALGLALLVSACLSPNPQPAGLTPVPTLAPAATLTLAPAIQGGAAAVAASAAAGKGDAALGVPVFEQHCTSCHGIEGQGGIGPALRNNQFIQTGGDQAIFTTIANGRPGTKMPAWLQPNGGPLVDAQINDVIAYLHVLQNVAPVPSATPEPEEATETPAPPGAPTPEPARPSNPGGVGPAASLAGDANRGKPDFGEYCSICHGPEGVLGYPNPGSEDGAVPELNPIDPTIANPDPKVFAANVDLFVEHGSVPDGPNPSLLMPSFGDQKMLTDQQIADIIAYIIQLNSGK